MQDNEQSDNNSLVAELANSNGVDTNQAQIDDSENVESVPSLGFQDDRTGSVVRYILNANTPVFSDIEQSKQVALFQAGEPIVVTIEGDWAQLEQGYFVSVSSLSKIPVARKSKKNVWRVNNFYNRSSFYF